MTIRSRDIRRVSLEGGGGKGLLFPGALIALVEKGVLTYRPANEALQYSPMRLSGDPVVSLSGASAGAITTLLLSCGYTPTEILLIMFMTNKAEFFDVSAETFPLPWGPGTITGRARAHRVLYPQYDEHTGSGIVATSPFMRMLLNVMRGTAEGDMLEIVDSVGRQFSTFLADLIRGADVGDLLEDLGFPAEVLGILACVSFLGGKLPRAAFSAITNHAPEAGRSLLGHFGLFAGAAIRDFLNRWVTIARYRLTATGTDRWHEVFTQELMGADVADVGARATATFRVLQHFSEEYTRARNPNTPEDAAVQALRGLMRTTFRQHFETFRVPMHVTGTNIERSVT